MNRREVMAGAAATALPVSSAVPAQPAAPVQGGGSNVVERFGFVPDGKTDNYAAFHRWADHVNVVRGGSYVFPPGVYWVDKYRTAPHGTRDRRFVVNAEIVGCNGLSISGYGARIVLNGNFHRPGRLGRSGVPVGIHMSTFMPFEIRRCRNVTIAGLEMDGGVRGMTRDQNVAEGYAFLIALSACSNVSLIDLDLHHSQVDAILLSDDVIISGVRPGRTCRNVSLKRVKCRNNARGGLAPLQVVGLSAVDCEFNGNGFPGGRYLYHEPGFGVDVEPDRSAPADVDSRTADLEFVRCNFYDNIAAIFVAYTGNYRGYCRFLECNSSNRHNMPNHMILTWPQQGMLVEGGDHDAGAGCIYLSWSGWTGSVTRLRKMRIRSSHIFGLLHPISGNFAEVQDCVLTGTHRTADSGHFPFFAQDPGGGRRNLFRGNRVFIPAAHKDHSRPIDIEPQFHNTIVADNHYSTDLAVAGEYFSVFYTNCLVRNERFRGRFPGPRDTFRPGPNHDTRLPFSMG